MKFTIVFVLIVLQIVSPLTYAQEQTNGTDAPVATPAPAPTPTSDPNASCDVTCAGDLSQMDVQTRSQCQAYNAATGQNGSPDPLYWERVLIGVNSAAAATCLTAAFFPLLGPMVIACNSTSLTGAALELAYSHGAMGSELKQITDQANSDVAQANAELDNQLTQLDGDTNDSIAPEAVAGGALAAKGAAMGALGASSLTQTKAGGSAFRQRALVGTFDFKSKPWEKPGMSAFSNHHSTSQAMSKSINAVGSNISAENKKKMIDKKSKALGRFKALSAMYAAQAAFAAALVGLRVQSMGKIDKVASDSCANLQTLRSSNDIKGHLISFPFRTKWLLSFFNYFNAYAMESRKLRSSELTGESVAKAIQKFRKESEAGLEFNGGISGPDVDMLKNKEAALTILNSVPNLEEAFSQHGGPIDFTALYNSIIPAKVFEGGYQPGDYLSRMFENGKNEAEIISKTLGITTSSNKFLGSNAFASSNQAKANHLSPSSSSVSYGPITLKDIQNRSLAMEHPLIDIWHEHGTDNIFEIISKRIGFASSRVIQSP